MMSLEEKEEEERELPVQAASRTGQEASLKQIIKALNKSSTKGRTVFFSIRKPNSAIQ